MKSYIRLYKLPKYCIYTKFYNLNSEKNHLKFSKILFKSVDGSYNLYLIILGKKKDPINDINTHQRYVKLNEKL